MASLCRLGGNRFTSDRAGESRDKVMRGKETLRRRKYEADSLADATSASLQKRQLWIKCYDCLDCYFQTNTVGIAFRPLAFSFHCFSRTFFSTHLVSFIFPS